MLAHAARSLIAIMLGLSMLFAAAGPARAADDDDRKLRAAVQEAAFYNLERAEELFREVMDGSPPGSDRWAQAAFGAATARQHRLPLKAANAQEALRLFRDLAAKAPQSKYAPRATYNAGRILEQVDEFGDPQDLEGARAEYQTVLDEWPTDLIASEAAMRIAGTYVQTFDEPRVRRGVRVLEDWLVAHPDDRLASTMWQYLAETYFFPLQDYARSVQCYEKVDAIGWVDKGNQGPDYWRIAQMAERYLNDRATAVKYYTKIVIETPTSGKAYESQRALERLGAPEPEVALFKALEGAAPTAAATTQPAAAAATQGVGR